MQPLLVYPPVSPTNPWFVPMSLLSLCLAVVSLPVAVARRGLVVPAVLVQLPLGVDDLAVPICFSSLALVVYLTLRSSWRPRFSCSSPDRAGRPFDGVLLTALAVVDDLSVPQLLLVARTGLPPSPVFCTALAILVQLARGVDEFAVPQMLLVLRAVAHSAMRSSWFNRFSCSSSVVWTTSLLLVVRVVVHSSFRSSWLMRFSCKSPLVVAVLHVAFAIAHDPLATVLRRRSRCITYNTHP